MYRIITKVINKYEFNSKFFSTKEIKKIIRADIIEDSEEYFVIRAIKNQDKQKSNPKLNDKAKITPK